MNLIRLIILTVFAALSTTFDGHAADTLDRTVLPIAEPDYPHSTVFDAPKATAPPRFEVKAPADSWAEHK